MQAPDPKYCGPSISAATWEARRILGQTCSLGNLEAVTRLANTEPRDSEYFTHGLSAAVHHKHNHIADFLLSKGAVIGWPALYAATKDGDVGIFEVFMRHGWDINSPMMGGEVALGHVLTDETRVQWFLEHGASPNLGPESKYAHPRSSPIDGSGWCLDICAARSKPTILDMLLSHGANLENSLALHVAAGSGTDGERIPMMAHLIGLGFDIDGSDEKRGRNHAIGTPLHYAINARSKENIKYLLKKGADPHKTLLGRMSPLTVARSISQDLAELFQDSPQQ